MVTINQAPDFRLQSFINFVNERARQQAIDVQRRHAEDQGSGAAGAGIGAAAALILAPFTAGASLAFLPAAASVGGAIGTAIDPPGGRSTNANDILGIVRSGVGLAGDISAGGSTGGTFAQRAQEGGLADLGDSEEFGALPPNPSRGSAADNGDDAGSKGDDAGSKGDDAGSKGDDAGSKGDDTSAKQFDTSAQSFKAFESFGGGIDGGQPGPAGTRTQQLIDIAANRAGVRGPGQIARQRAVQREANSLAGFARQLGMTPHELETQTRASGLTPSTFRNELFNMQAEQEAQSRLQQQQADFEEEARQEFVESNTELVHDKQKVAQLENYRASIQEGPYRPGHREQLNAEIDAQIDQIRKNPRRMDKRQSTPREAYDQSKVVLDDGTILVPARSYTKIYEPDRPKPIDREKILAGVLKQKDAFGKLLSDEAVMAEVERQARLMQMVRGEVPPGPSPALPNPEFFPSQEFAPGQLTATDVGQEGARSGPVQQQQAPPPSPAQAALQEGQQALESIAAQLPADLPVSKWPKNAKRAGKQVAQQIKLAIEAQFATGEELAAAIRQDPGLRQMLKMVQELLK